MRRRDILQLLVASALASSTKVRAASQVTTPARRIGWLETARGSTHNWSLTAEELRAFGWTRGVNLRADLHFPTTPLQLPALAKELVSAQPDLIVTNGTPSTKAVLEKTRTIPVIFFEVTDPLGAGLVQSFSRPGGNATGFAAHEPALAGKWLQLLKEVDPRIHRAALLFNPDTAPDSGSPFVREFERSAATLSVEPIIGSVRSEPEIEPLIAALAGDEPGALIVLPDLFTLSRYSLIINFAEKHRVPAIYSPQFTARYTAGLGGLIAYGPDGTGVHRDLASYIDRVLRGERPGDLPVQSATKHELAINLRTAQALGLTIPPALLARADQLIEGTRARNWSGFATSPP